MTRIIGNFGTQTRRSRQSALIARTPGRSLLGLQSRPREPRRAFMNEPFTDQTEAVAELASSLENQGLQVQGGEGILDIARSVFRFGRKALNPSVLDTAKTIGKAAQTLVTGRVGTTISNVLSERFNKNPNWRPGFQGEAHLVLPTKYGLTRANFCGPGTNLEKRRSRGDVGVSQIDSACQIHDNLYNIAKSEGDIRAADERLIRDIDKSTQAGSVQKAILKAGIRAKTLGEDVGLFSAETFTEIPSLHQQGQGLHLNGLRKSLQAMPRFGNARQNKFLHDAPRDLRSILHNTLAKSGLSPQKRMGGNGLIHPGVLSDDNLDRLSRRLAERQGIEKNINNNIHGNVRRAVASSVGDPTISNFMRGNGYRRGFTSRCRNHRQRGSGGAAIGLQHPNRQVRSPGHKVLVPDTDPMAKTDLSFRKSVDPTIRNVGSLSPSGVQTGRGPFKTADPGGGGLNIARKGVMSGYGGTVLQGEGIVEILEKPADLLRRNVLKSLKKKNRKRVLKRAKPIIKHAVGDVPAVIDIVKDMLKKRGLKGRGQEGGQFGILAGLAASIIVPEIVKAIRGKGIQAGSGPGKKLALDVARRHGITAKNLGMSGRQVSSLVLNAIKKADKKYLHSGKGLTGPALPGQQTGGQFGFLASLAASVIIPEIIKAVRK